VSKRTEAKDIRPSDYQWGSLKQETSFMLVLHYNNVQQTTSSWSTAQRHSVNLNLYRSIC